jgi:hypothetical protein
MVLTNFSIAGPAQPPIQESYGVLRPSRLLTMFLLPPCRITSATPAALHLPAPSDTQNMSQGFNTTHPIMNCTCCSVMLSFPFRPAGPQLPPNCLEVSCPICPSPHPINQSVSLLAVPAAFLLHTCRTTPAAQTASKFSAPSASQAPSVTARARHTSCPAATWPT